MALKLNCVLLGHLPMDDLTFLMKCKKFKAVFSILRLSNWPAGMWSLPMGVPRGQWTAQEGSKVPRKNFRLCIVRKPQTR